MHPQVYEYEEPADSDELTSQEKEKMFAQTQAKPVIPRIALQECTQPDLEEERGENQWDDIEIEDPVIGG